MDILDSDIQRRLHYVSAVACGVFAAMIVHIVLTMLGVGLDAVMRGASGSSKGELVSALAWWAVAAAAFAGGWATGAYLIAASRERDLVYRVARGLLIGLIFVAATVGGIMSKTGNLGGTVDVVAGLAALAVGAVCAYCGTRLAYLNAEQV